MERCYVCNRCGKCDELEWGIAPPAPVCLDCGHVVEPGESPARCAVCGGGRIAAAGRGASPGQGRAQPASNRAIRETASPSGGVNQERREHE